jgi:hypothetical protein
MSESDDECRWNESAYSPASHGRSRATAPASTAQASSDEARDWTITTPASTAITSNKAITRASTVDVVPSERR